ncbi:heat shock protein beta-3 [Melozone crissalis]|uniref:heat shock protein beta-3 n=1 Tax=Melozone crissalis TaxID=40204 RepID=UPI0023DB139E|nr:heat shock protein beta-3 [Melozone crissalis]
MPLCPAEPAPRAPGRPCPRIPAPCWKNGGGGGHRGHRRGKPSCPAAASEEHLCSAFPGQPPRWAAPREAFEARSACSKSERRHQLIDWSVGKTQGWEKLSVTLQFPSTAGAAADPSASAMAEAVIRHWVETPVRYQEQFVGQELEAHKLNHLLYALPGPATAAPSDQRCAPESTAGAGKSGQEEENTQFRVLLDVVQFRPEDIIIQTFEGWLLIKAQHGPRMDEHGFISRSFTRQYKLPNGVENKDLSALFCHDGILVVEMKNSVEKN